LCATGDFFGFYGAEIVFPIAKSIDNCAEMKGGNRLRRLFAAQPLFTIYYPIRLSIVQLKSYGSYQG
jgi:hypothetical protein